MKNLIEIGESLEELVGLPYWSEDNENIYYKQDAYSFQVSKEIFCSDILSHWELVELLADNAKKSGCLVLDNYDNLPFANLLETKEEQELANYILTTNTSFAYDLVKSSGMNGLYEFISGNALNAINTYNKLVKEGKISIARDHALQVLYDGVLTENETTVPLILDFEPKKFTWTDGIIPVEIDNQGNLNIIS